MQILHNPRCGTSRKVLGILREHGIEPQIIEYLKNPLSESQIREIVKKTGRPAVELVRKKEAEWQENHSINEPEELIIRAMAEHPILIERPVLIEGERACVCRPPEKALDFIEQSKQ